MSETNEILNSSGTQLGAAIRTKALTSFDVVRVHVERAKAVNPYLNAIVRDRYEQALANGRALDDQHLEDEEGESRPFWAVPCTIKECFAYEGMPQSSGLLARKDFIASENATAVQRLLDNGAIPLGVTNLSELCMWMESHNPVYGRTSNPYDPTRIVGGSSGGEGAIIGSGASPFGLGSDVGGSIRMPAFFNGVFGHKPSGGRVPATGQYPTAQGRALHYLTTGPLARKAEDLWPLLQILEGPDGHDEECRVYPSKSPDTVSISQLRVINIPNNGRNAVSDELVQAQKSAVDALREAGADIVDKEFEALARSFDIWSSMLSKEQSRGSFRNSMQRSIPSLMLELMKMTVGMGQHTLPAVALGLTEDLQFLRPAFAEEMVETGLALRQQISDAVGEHGVFLFPSYSCTAPRHKKPITMRFDWVYTAIWNVMGFPVTQAPLGLGSSGLPTGVQIGAQVGNDHLTIAVAKALEEKLGGWVMPEVLHT